MSLSTIFQIYVEVSFIDGRNRRARGKPLRDRPFNLQGVMVFCFVQKIDFVQHESTNIYFICRTKREIVFQNLTLCYMTKTLNQIFFFLHQNQNIFFSIIGNPNIFVEKNITPLPPSS